ncbi:ATP-binding protein [Sporomusa silvacetica]|uniref:ATP-binding protein n=1 Tax=Sporomusa silvacetica TaxID=55504 RepID=UPI002481F9A5|nr:ATP-binding protein [Sporomusa silvacetica]
MRPRQHTLFPNTVYLKYSQYHPRPTPCLFYDLLFKVVSERSERASIIVTTNLEFSRWTEMFESITMVAALVDRLTFKSHLLDMNGSSYRMNHAITND